MKRWLVCSILLLSVIFNIQAEEEVEKERPQRVLLIFLDESEINFQGALSASFFAALEQRAAPILVSAFLFREFLWKAELVDAAMRAPVIDNPLLRMVVAVKHASPEAFTNGTVNKQLSDITSSLGPTDVTQRWNALLANRSFNPTDWLIFAVDNAQSAYLLVPREYLEKITGGSAFQGQGHRQELSFLLGFTLDSMKPIQQISAVVASPARRLDPLRFVPLIQSIFVSDATYFKAGKQGMIPAWSIYLLGHGSARETVAMLPIAEFPHLLDFFDSRVTVKMFIYDSCYAAGGNAERMYQDSKRVGSYKKIYSYPIMTGAITDAPTGTYAPSFFISYDGTHRYVHGPRLDVQNKRLIVSHTEDFKTFVDRALSQATPIDFAFVIEPIVPLASRERLEARQSGQTKTAAQIRLPGLPWFSVVDAQNRVVSLTTVMAATREKTLSVKKFYQQQRELAPTELEQKMGAKKIGVPLASRRPSQKHRNAPGNDPIALLLYSLDVPYTIDMSGIVFMPEFISMVPGRAVHYFASINAPQMHLGEFAQHFENAPAVYKVFLIDTLRIISDAINCKATLQDVLMYDGKVYFECTGKVWGAQGPSYTDFTVASRDERQEYVRLVNNYREEILKRQGEPLKGGIITTPAHELSCTVKKLQELGKKHTALAEQRMRKIKTAEEKYRIAFEREDVSNNLAALARQLASLAAALPL